jgi:hypothetical protein
MIAKRSGEYECESRSRKKRLGRRRGQSQQWREVPVREKGFRSEGEGGEGSSETLASRHFSVRSRRVMEASLSTSGVMSGGSKSAE